jgi:hypothetical protein
VNAHGHAAVGQRRHLDAVPLGIAAAALSPRHVVLDRDACVGELGHATSPRSCNSSLRCRSAVQMFLHLHSTSVRIGVVADVGYSDERRSA